MRPYPISTEIPPPTVTAPMGSFRIARAVTRQVLTIPTIASSDATLEACMEMELLMRGAFDDLIDISITPVQAQEACARTALLVGRALDVL